MLLNFSCILNTSVRRFGSSRNVRATHLKNTIRRRKLGSEDYFPYTTEQKKIFVSTIAVIIREMSSSYTETCEFSFLVFYVS